MSVLCIDFETYYDREYGFAKMTTEEYVRDPRWETIGFAYNIDGGPTTWVPKPDVERVIKSIDWSDKLVLCQNTAFDGAILAWHYGVQPQGWLDTMGMSRALFPHEKSHSLKAQAERMNIGVKGTEVENALGKRYADFSEAELSRYGDYCCNDVVLTLELFKQYMALGFPKIELKLIDLTLRMFIEPVLRLDRELLVKHLQEVVDRKEQLMDELQYKFGGREDVKTMLMSNEKFAAALESLGVEPPRKVSATTGKLAFAFAKTDEKFKELLEHPNPDVQALVSARLGNKTTIEETRTARFIGMADRGLFPVPLRYYGAHSGRWSGCLVADTRVLVYNPIHGVMEKLITDVMADDLVWDGVEFVMHEGVQFSGFQEVISWDGITGTEDHVVYTDAGEISLRDAMQGAHRIQTPGGPSQDAVDAARELANDY